MPESAMKPQITILQVAIAPKLWNALERPTARMKRRPVPGLESPAPVAQKNTPAAPGSGVCLSWIEGGSLG